MHSFPKICGAVLGTSLAERRIRADQTKKGNPELSYGFLLALHEGTEGSFWSSGYDESDRGIEASSEDIFKYSNSSVHYHSGKTFLAYAARNSLRALVRQVEKGAQCEARLKIELFPTAL